MWARAISWRTSGSFSRPTWRARATRSGASSRPDGSGRRFAALTPRSKTSIDWATAHPWLTSPMTSSSVSSTSSKNSWQNSSLPLISRIGWTVTPGASVRTANQVRPLCFGTSQSVRARHMP